MPLGEGITITMVRAEHSSELLHTDASGNKSVHPGGEPAGFIIELENGFTIYHAGDTGVFGDMSLIKTLYDPDVALLPIGGHFTMDPGHAAYAIRNLLKPKQVIPIHFATFPQLKGTPAQLREALGDMAGVVNELQPGDTVKY
jgi:L-ascorbate metabolism protein UlaG (beta-lactamase superfamily)